ncbi:MAG: 3-dehydroquinate synthase II [Candidatus Bathyarchaeia archaeon]
MAREFWIKIDSNLPKEMKEKLVKETCEFCTAYIVDPADETLARKSGAKTLVSAKDGDIILLESIKKVSSAKTDRKKCIQTVISSGKDENKIVKAAEAGIDYVIAKCENWKIIPLENLIAKIKGKSKLLTSVANAEEAKLAFEILELGVDGIIVELLDVKEIKRIYEAAKQVKPRIAEAEEEGEKLPLSEAKITQIAPLLSGARTCIDTCDLMSEGEGMLIGCQSSGLFLIQAETAENPFVTPRPFRVNAGSIAQYTLASGGTTKYLSELKIGDEVLIVDREGRSRVTNICRTKIEWRPLLLIEAEHENRTFKVILQNAETIRVVTKNGSKSVKELAKGDAVLVHIQEGGRHFGIPVKERVMEK